MIPPSTPKDASREILNPTQRTDIGPRAKPTDALSSQADINGPSSISLGLLLDDSAGHHLTESKDIAILRRLKHAILEGQHPYFKANIDLANLQDLVLTSGSRPISALSTSQQLDSSATMNPSTTQQLPSTVSHMKAVALEPRSTLAVDATTDQNSGASQASIGGVIQPDTTRKMAEDVNMDHDAKPTGNASAASHLDPENQNTISGGPGSISLHGIVESAPSSQLGHKRKISDTPTLIEIADGKTDIQIKRESPPYQLSGSQSQGIEASSSSLASFSSNASAALTSEDGAKSDNTIDTAGDLSGYDPKYGSKSEYLRRQKVRTKMIESIEEKSRRSANRPEEKPVQKSPAQPAENGDRRGGGHNASPVRGLEHPPWTQNQPVPPAADSNNQGVGPNNARRTPPPGPASERPSTSFEASPRGRRQGSRRISPPGKYPRPPPRRYSPPRDYPSQYLPYDDPRSSRPRPIVSSPPRGSPPHEPPHHEPPHHEPPVSCDDDFHDFALLDFYCSKTYPLRKILKRELRASPLSGRPQPEPYNVDNDNRPVSTRRLPRISAPPPSRNSPPRDLSHDRTPFGSSGPSANPAAGYRPHTQSDPPSSRYDDRSAHWEPSRLDWSSRVRLADSKPKLQDRLTADPAWAHDSVVSRPRDGFPSRPPHDSFALRPVEDYAPRYRSEPSPPRYSDGLRAGFGRPGEIDGIRPMKRSRPDDGYPPHGGPSSDLARYDLDARPAGGEYYREPPRRADNGQEPRSRPPYINWG